MCVRLAGAASTATARSRYALTRPGLSALQASSSRRTEGAGPVAGAGGSGGAGKIMSTGGRVRMAGDEDPATTLERRFRLLLHAYPAAYRRDRAEEMVGTLLETTPAGRTWPLARDIRALLLGGLRARSAQNRRLGTPANLRLAALLGCAVFLCCIASNYLGYGKFAVAIPAGQIPTTGYPPQFASGWAVAPALLILAAVLLAWLPGRKAVALGAVAAGTAAVAYDFSVALQTAGTPGLPLQNPATYPDLLPLLTILLPLAALVLLSGGQARLPRLWLWLPGVVIVQPVITQLVAAAHWSSGSVEPYPQLRMWLVMFAVATVWIGVDARPAIGVAIALGLQTSSFLLIVLLGSGWGWTLTSMWYLFL